MANCFKPIAYVPDKVTKKIDDDIFIITRELVDDYIPQNDGVVKTTKVIEKSRVNRKEYIQSFVEDVGLENILRKIEMTDDYSLLDQTHRVPGSIDEDGKERLVDYTGVPADVEAAARMVNQGHELFATIPEDLKANRSFVDFVEGCTNAEVKAYLQKVLAAKEVNNE